MTEPLISVIIPIYNVEAYLPRCLESVLASSYHNLEIVLVDDGSPDNCETICDKYAAGDERIKVIHQENKGLSAARNAGLAIAKGEYVTFVDSDDVISPVIYEMCVRVFAQENVDIVSFEYSSKLNDVAESVQHLNRVHILEKLEDILSVVTMFPETRSYTWTYCMVWNKLYRREIITTLFDTNCIIGEDMCFNWLNVQNCKKMAVLPIIGYYYRENEESITRSANKYRRSRHTYEKKIMDAKILCNIAENDLNLSPRFQSYLEARAAYAVHQALWRIASGNALKEYLEFESFARQRIRKYWFHLLKERSCKLRVRIMGTLCRFSFPLWRLAVRILGK